MQNEFLTNLRNLEISNISLSHFIVSQPTSNFWKRSIHLAHGTEQVVDRQKRSQSLSVPILISHPLF